MLAPDYRPHASFLFKEMAVLHAWEDDGVPRGIYRHRDGSMFIVAGDGTRIRALTLDEAKKLKRMHPEDLRSRWLLCG